ncbi:MAG: copper homeostasis periplasmic binding protein CopC [Novosphingobium sp.]
MRSVSLLFAAATMLVFAGAAEAHPRLVSATPSAAISRSGRIELRFNETLMPAFSKADLVMAGQRGMPGMKMRSAVAVSRDGKTLVVTPNTRLGHGRYTVAWRAVSTDTHRVAGTYGFTVR